jgi:4-hydroxybenzoate polyprenyltransferase
VTAAAAVEARPGIGARALGLLEATHPIPNLMFVAVVGVFSWLAASAADRAVSPWALTALLLGVFGAQAVIGATNDYCDRELDADTQPSKPIARAVVTANQVLALAVACGVATVALIAPLGLVPLGLTALIVALGLAYDLGLKGSPASGILYALHFPLFPLLAWSVFGEWESFLPWVVPIGAGLGVAMNVANTLPDLEGDIAHGLHGLPHVLGMRRSLAVAWGLPLVVLAFMWAIDLAGLVPADTAGMVVATAAALVSVGLAFALYRRRPQPATLRLTFLIQAAGVVVMTCGWVAAAS